MRIKSDILGLQQIVQQPTAGPKQIAAPTFTTPIFEDEDDESTVLVHTSTSPDSSLNFVTALRNMQ